MTLQCICVLLETDCLLFAHLMFPGDEEGCISGVSCTKWLSGSGWGNYETVGATASQTRLEREHRLELLDQKEQRETDENNLIKTSVLQSFFLFMHVLHTRASVLCFCQN